MTKVIRVEKGSGGMYEPELLRKDDELAEFARFVELRKKSMKAKCPKCGKFAQFDGYDKNPNLENDYFARFYCPRCKYTVIKREVEARG